MANLLLARGAARQREIAIRPTRRSAARVEESVAHERLLPTLSAFFGVLALLLATIGLYGVTSYNVTQRRK